MTLVKYVATYDFDSDYGNFVERYMCRTCGHEFWQYTGPNYIEYNFCPYCGREIDWDTSFTERGNV